MKTVLITGGARGIGRAAARLFAEKGFHVAVNYKSSENEAKSLCAELQGKGLSALPFYADVSDFFSVLKMTEAVERSFSEIDVLINNAGTALLKPFTDTSPEEWDGLFAANVKGVYNTSRAVASSMIRKKAGSIINISSMWGVTGASCEVAYSASKAAVIGFTKALAKELGPSNIRVNCVAPGVIKTDMLSGLSMEDIEALRLETPLGTIGRPEDIAETLLFLGSEKSAFITGEVINVNGGMLI